MTRAEAAIAARDAAVARAASVERLCALATFAIVAALTVALFYHL